jgi:hypothetical protein
MTDDTLAILERDLRALGTETRTPAPSSQMAGRVLRQVTPTPVSRPFWTRGRVGAAVAAALVALLAAPPVRAAVADWFGFAGVLVQDAPAPDVSDAPPPPSVDDAMSVADAARLVAFTPLVPTALGTPEAVDVSADRRVVSMTWSTADGPVRLDQFDGRLDYTVLKTAADVEYAAVGSVDALWFDSPHEVAFLDERGRSRSESPRLAGTTLIWPADDVTLRLEGDLTLSRATEIGASATPYGE